MRPLVQAATMWSEEHFHYELRGPKFWICCLTWQPDQTTVKNMVCFTEGEFLSFRQLSAVDPLAE